MAPRLVMLKGKVYGRLTLLESGSTKSKLLFQCSCGNTKRISGKSVRQGSSASCGCLSDEIKRSRKSDIPREKRLPELYRTWANMKSRVLNPNVPCHKWYEEISIQRNWIESYNDFYAYVSSLPNFDKRVELGLTLDRINNDGNYEEGNLKWSTQSEQMQNTRRKKGPNTSIQLARFGLFVGTDGIVKKQSDS